LIHFQQITRQYWFGTISSILSSSVHFLSHCCCWV